jgi:hypothetical protein
MHVHLIQVIHHLLHLPSAQTPLSHLITSWGNVLLFGRAFSAA